MGHGAGDEGISVEWSHGLFGRPSQFSHGKLVAAAPWPGLMRRTQRDRKPQMRTEAVYVASRIPDCAQCACLRYTQRASGSAPEDQGQELCTQTLGRIT